MTNVEFLPIKIGEHQYQVTNKNAELLILENENGETILLDVWEYFKFLDMAAA